MKKKIFFLGYNRDKTKIIDFLRKKYEIIFLGQKKINNIKYLMGADLVISFGYNKIIPKKILSKLVRPPINLHISYLPYNKGSHPNFWSFVENTPSGVTIHEIDEGIDTGKIIYQKKINFKKKHEITFESSYNILINEVEKLFFKNYKSLINKKYKTKKINLKGTFHKKSELPKNIKSWNIKIKDYLDKAFEKF